MRLSSLGWAIAAVLAAQPAAASSGVLDRWKDYAAASIAPSFDWYRPALVQAPGPGRSGWAPAETGFAFAAFGGMGLRFDADDALAGWRQGALPHLVEGGGLATTRSFSGRGVDSSLGATRLGLQARRLGEFGVAAVVARQHYATHGFGYGEWDGTRSHPRYPGVGTGVRESSTGSGVRLDWGRELGAQGWRVDAAWQSRIEMDAFKAYRGVYSEPGDFDIPGYAELALEVPVSRGVRLSGEVQRVFYQDIPTFTSASLPTRFLALLGDAASPEFAWRDLTVFALELRIGDPSAGRWTLRAATQQQPRPTSALLDRALSELYSDRNLAVAWERETPGWGAFRVAASYSPVTYFLGSAPYLQRGFQTGRQLEFEAQWTLSF